MKGDMVELAPLSATGSSAGYGSLFLSKRKED